MNFLDIIIIFLILFGAIIGFKRGFTRELVSFAGFILILFLAYLLKNPVSMLFYTYLPFFKFGGVLKGVTVLNILIYEVIAFLLVISVLLIIFRLILFASKMFEKILNATIILGFFSKILGMIVGVVHYYVIAYLLLFILSFPIFDAEAVNKSKLRGPILKNTPILSSVTSKTVEVQEKFIIIKGKYESETSANEFNLETLDLFLEYQIIKPENVRTLIEKEKLVLENVEDVLQKYE